MRRQDSVKKIYLPSSRSIPYYVESGTHKRPRFYIERNFGGRNGHALDADINLPTLSGGLYGGPRDQKRSRIQSLTFIDSPTHRYEPWM